MMTEQEHQYTVLKVQHLWVVINELTGHDPSVDEIFKKLGISDHEYQSAIETPDTHEAVEVLNKLGTAFDEVLEKARLAVTEAISHLTGNRKAQSQ